MAMRGTTPLRQAEANMRRFFLASGPTTHQIVIGLVKAGLISRQPDVP
jgi:hypothetical protein